MSDRRPKKVIHTSPAGRFRYPKLNAPDYGTEKFPKPDGDFNVQLALAEGGPAHERLVSLLQPLWDAAIEEARAAYEALPAAKKRKAKEPDPSDLFEPIFDENDNPTGEVYLKFKTKASGEFKKGPKAGKRWNKTLPIFDAKGRLMAKAPDIWGGTVGKISFTTRPFFIEASGLAGLSLGLEAVQVLDLVSAGMRTADQFGFGEEDGYAHTEDAATSDEETDDEFTSTDEDENSHAPGDF